MNVGMCLHKELKLFTDYVSTANDVSVICLLTCLHVTRLQSVTKSSKQLNLGKGFEIPGVLLYICPGES